MSRITRMQKTKILVTGGAGFIGSNITAELLGRGFEVHVIDDLFTGKRELVPKEATFHQADIRDFTKLLEIFEKVRPEKVYHLAAHSRVRTSIDDPLDSLTRNVVGTQNVLEASRQSGVKRLVFTSSSAVYGTPKEAPFHEDMQVIPESPYGVHKYAAEMLCRLYSDLYELPTVIVRCFNAYGLNQPPQGANAVVIPIFLSQRKAGQPMTVLGDGNQSRDFIHISDLIEGIIQAMENKMLGQAEVINLGSGVPISVKKIVELIRGPVQYKEAAAEQLHTWADITKAKKLLNWEPTVRLEDEIGKYKKEWGIE